MNTKQKKLELEKKRSKFIRLFLVFMVIGAAFSLLAVYFEQNDILGYLGVASWIISLICIVIAYRTGKEYLNL